LQWNNGAALLAHPVYYVGSILTWRDPN